MTLQQAVNWLWTADWSWILIGLGVIAIVGGGWMIGRDLARSLYARFSTK